MCLQSTEGPLLEVQTDYEQAAEFPIVLGYKQGCSAILCPFLFFFLSPAQKCAKNPFAL